MASDQTLRAIITVLDRTSEPVRQINARLAALSSPLREIGSRIGELAELTGIKNIGERAKEALEHVRHLGEGLLEMAGPLAALGAAGSVAGLVEIAKSTAEFAENLDIGSKMTGIATEKLAGWHYAAGLVNIDVDRLDRGFTFLNRNINEAAAGKAKDVAEILRRMGVTNTPGHLVGTADALRAIAAEVQHLTGTGQIQLATDMMAKLFGARQGAQLLPLFELGPEKLNEILEGAKEAGISLTAAQTEAGHGFMEQYKGMTASVEGLKIAIGNELFPVLTPVVEAMRGWLNVNREWVATRIGEAIRDFSGWVKSVDWVRVGDDVKAFGADIAWVVDKIGGIGPAIAIVAGISLAPAIAAFGELGGAVAAAAAKLVLFPAASFIGTLATLVPAIGGLRDVWIALDLAMDANPIGAVILAATLLGAAAYEVIEHWKPIEAFFEQLWQNVVDKFHMAWDEIRPIVESLENAVNWVGRHLPGGGGAVIDGMPLSAAPPLSSLPGAAAAAGGGAGAPGATKVTVDFKNLPPGAAVSTESSGSAATDVNVGYAMGWMN